MDALGPLGCVAASRDSDQPQEERREIVENRQKQKLDDCLGIGTRELEDKMSLRRRAL